MADAAYRPRKHVNRVLAAARVRHSARLVLEILCRLAEFDRPEVTVTKPQITEQSGLHARTVRYCMRELKEAGVIRPVRNAQGGRGNAVTYRLCVIEGDAGPAPETAEPAGLWPDLCALFKDSDPRNFAAWIQRLDLVRIDDGALVLSAPSAFIADHCRTHFAGPLVGFAKSLDPSVRRIEILAAE